MCSTGGSYAPQPPTRRVPLAGGWELQECDSLLLACCRVDGSAGTIRARVCTICTLCAVLAVLRRQGGDAAHQVTDTCAAEQFEECRNLCHHVHDIASETAGSHSIVAVAAAGGDNSNL